MTQVGHTLTGAALGVLCTPPSASLKWKTVYSVAFALLANVPDLPFRNWGHDRYDISHSIFVNLLLIMVVVIALSFWRNARRRIGGWGVVAGGAIAWLSHLLLDSFYNHGWGIAIFWPVSEARLALPIPWFSVLSSPPPLTSQVLLVCLVEFVCYFPLLLLTIGLKESSAVRRLFKGILKSGV